MIDLYPAIDLLGGPVVRLRQGDYADETVYGDDPVAVARTSRRRVLAGSTWSTSMRRAFGRSREPTGRRRHDRVRGRRRPARVQTGGGVRSLDDARELADAGVARVVMGSAAVSNPSLVEAASDVVAVAVGLDHRDGDVAVHGWTEGSGLALDDAYALFPTAEVFVITDIGRDGMLVGPDLDGLARSAELAGAPVIAKRRRVESRRRDCAERIENLGGVITGKALYEGRFTISEALVPRSGPGRREGCIVKVAREGCIVKVAS